MATPPKEITFFETLVPSILSGKKTITIRDESESHYVPNTIVDVLTLETNKKVGRIEIISVEPILFSQLNEIHAQQEFMKLSQLKELIRKIYPTSESLFVISFKLIS